MVPVLPLLTTAEIWISESTVKELAKVPPILTDVVPFKYVP